MDPIIMEEYNGCLITTDKSLMSVQDVYKWLSEESYWSQHIPIDIVKKAFDHSFCIGALFEGKQIGYARLITDYATFAYLADVYVAGSHRGQGISKKMMELLFNIDWVKRLRAIKLATHDAQDLYRKYGFTESRFPERNMEIVRRDIYSNN